jgi:CHRD domain
MNKKLRTGNTFRFLALTGAFAALAGCSSMGMSGGGQHVDLSGANEVPAVATSASGMAMVTVGADCSVKASVTATGMTATASHIHVGAAGANGPVAVPFTKTGDNTFAAPDGAKMNPEQCASYKAGNAYVNVHSAKSPGGEIRGQLKASSSGY